MINFWFWKVFDDWRRKFEGFGEDLGQEMKENEEENEGKDA